MAWGDQWGDWWRDGWPHRWPRQAHFGDTLAGFGNGAGSGDLASLDTRGGGAVGVFEYDLVTDQLIIEAVRANSE